MDTAHRLDTSSTNYNPASRYQPITFIMSPWYAPPSLIFTNLVTQKPSSTR
jgi:hypothetical protein